MGMILRIASSRIVGQGDIVGRSGYFSLNLSANSVMRGRLDARRTLKSLVADLRFNIYFDKEDITGVQNISADVKGVEVYASNGKIMVNTVNPVKITVYTLSGAAMYETVASSGTNTYDAASGFYIVKITDENGNLATYKVLVK